MFNNNNLSHFSTMLSNNASGVGEGVTHPALLSGSFWIYSQELLLELLWISYGIQIEPRTVHANQAPCPCAL